MISAACPPASAPSRPSTPVPQVKYKRYDDAALQESYARIVYGLRDVTIPIYGPVFSEDKSDEMARSLIDAVLALPQSAELRQRAACAAAAIAPTVIAPWALGALAAGLTGLAAYGTYRALR